MTGRRCALTLAALIALLPAAMSAQSGEERATTAAAGPEGALRANRVRAPSDVDDIWGAIYEEGALSVAEATRRALAHSPKLHAQEARAREAEALAKGERVPLYGHTNLGVDYARLSRVEQPLELGTGETVSFIAPVNRGGLFTVFEYPLTEALLEDLPRYKAALGEQEAEMLQADAFRAITVRQSRDAYYAVGRRNADLLIARESLLEFQETEELTAAQLRVGVIPPAELSRAHAQTENAKVWVSRSTAALQTAEIRLRVLMGVSVSDPLRLSVNFEQEPPMPEAELDALVLEAFERRPELQARRKLERAAEQRERAARMGQLPRLSLGAELDYSRPNARYLPPLEEFRLTWAAGAWLDWSPDEFASARAEKGFYDGRADEYREQCIAVEDQIRLNVGRAYEALLASRKAYAAAVEGLVAARHNYEARFEQYRAGAAAVRDVIDGQRDLSRARREVVDARITQYRARNQLDFTLGRYSDPDFVPWDARATRLRAEDSETSTQSPGDQRDAPVDRSP